MERLRALKREEVRQKQQDRDRIAKGELRPDSLTFFATSKPSHRKKIDFSHVDAIPLEYPDELS